MEAALKTIVASGHLNVVVVCATVFLMYILWLLRKRITGVSISRSGGFQLTTGDADLILDLHNRLEPIDHACRMQIAEHTDALELVEVTKKSTLQTIFINQLACEILKMSAYANHHARELQLDHRTYCEKRLNRIHVKLSRYSLLLAEGARPCTEAIAAYIERWLLTVVLPPVLEACRRKVSYYNSLLLRKDISEHLRAGVKEWRQKNEVYIRVLTDLVSELQKPGETLFGVGLSHTNSSGVFRSDGPSVESNE